MEIIIAIVSVLGLSGALIFQLYLSYKERKEMLIMLKSKDLSEFEYIVDKPKEDDEEKVGDKVVDIDAMPDLYQNK
jgi:hypothetical protein